MHPHIPLPGIPRAWLLLLTLVALLSSLAAAGTSQPASSPQTRFAASEIAIAVKASKDAKPEVRFAIDSGLPAQSFRIDRTEGGALTVVGGDDTGAMYGGLEIAEAIRQGSLPLISHSLQSPRIARRGIKFNIPLDLRSPSYSDNNTSFQANIPEVWKRDFWLAFFDEMARHRYNVLSLWNLHPFPALVKVPEFPDVAQNDVLRARKPFDDTFTHSGSDMFRKDYLENAEVVHRLTIEQKTAFWNQMLQDARDRGIEVYWITWNIFLFEAEGKHGITASAANPTTTSYFRASVRELIRQYPLLAGIGITAGENTGKKMMAGVDREKWLWDTYGEGVRDALKTQPGRAFRLIHRYHMSGQAEILNTFKELPCTFDLSFKYSIAHMYSIPNPPFFKILQPGMPPNVKCWLTVRNDDLYSFRWGDPDYARDYINNMPPPDRIAGFYMGPDGYCWGREAIDLDPETPRQLVMQKQWYSFMLWGRLAYDPTLPNSKFEAALAARFPEASAPRLFAALKAASQTMPLITRFWWGNIDLRWHPEVCMQYRGFFSVRDFASSKYDSMPGSNVLCIQDWRASKLGTAQANGSLGPIDIAEELESQADTALRHVAALRQHQGNRRELRLTLDDCEAMAQLGHYYASKIRAACALALFDATREPQHRTEAVAHATSAQSHWSAYAGLATRNYRLGLLNRIGEIDWKKLSAAVAQDIAIAREWKPGSLPLDRPPKTNVRPIQ